VLVVRKTQDFMQTYMEYSDASESPDSFHRWTAIGTVAGVLRRRCWINQGRFQWTPNFYLIFVAPPGIVQKSTTIGFGLDLLKQVKGIHFGPDSLTWQAMVEEMAGIQENMNIGGIVGAFYPMSCVTLGISELGTLLDTENKQMIDIMVDLWDSPQKEWRKKTKTQGEDRIVNPWINMMACTTPKWVGDNMTGQTISGGFLSRCLFVYGEEKRKLIHLPSQFVAAHHDELKDALVSDLRHIAQHIKGEYHYHRDAIQWDREWYDRHNAQDFSHLAFTMVSGYIQRKQTHIHKTAMVLAATRRDEMVIMKEDLITAERMVTDLEEDMEKVFGQMEIRTSSNMRYSDDVVTRVRYHKKINKQALYRDMFARKKMSKNDFDTIVKSAIAAGEIEQVGTDLIWVTLQSGTTPQSGGTPFVGPVQPGDPAPESESGVYVREGTASTSYLKSLVYGPVPRR